MSSGLLSMVVKVKSWADAISHLLVIALLLPGITVVVIAAHFPKARLVERRELDALDPLGALPEIEAGDHYAQRAAMLAADRLAVPAPGEQHILGREVGERYVGGVGVVGMEDHVPRGRLGLHDRQQVARAHAFPLVVIARPGSDAMDVAAALALGQIGELAPLPGRRLLDLAVDEQSPGMERNLGLDAEVEHRPVLDQALARRQALAGRGGLAGEQAALLGPLPLAVQKLVPDPAGQRELVVGHAPYPSMR